jgi:hypothetical protein
VATSARWPARWGCALLTFIMPPSTQSKLRRDSCAQVQLSAEAAKVEGTLTFECASLKADAAADEHLAAFQPKLVGAGAVVNVGAMDVRGVRLLDRATAAQHRYRASTGYSTGWSALLARDTRADNVSTERASERERTWWAREAIHVLTTCNRESERERADLVGSRGNTRADNVQQRERARESGPGGLARQYTC